MKREELKYRKGIARHKLFTMVIEPREHKDEDHVYNFILSLFQNVIEHEKKTNETTNNSLKTFLFEQSYFDKLVIYLIERDRDELFDPYELSIELVESSIKFGSEFYNNSKDELLDFLLFIIPNLSEDEASAFIQDDLLTEKSLAHKAAFWDRHET